MTRVISKIEGASELSRIMNSLAENGDKSGCAVTGQLLPASGQ